MPESDEPVPVFSLVVGTRGRVHQLARLFESLNALEGPGFEVLVVDQNADDRLLDVLKGSAWRFPIRHLRQPDLRGLNFARNAGWRAALGEFVLFPDDDAWYPPTFLERAVGLLKEHDADIVCGRSTDEQDRTINGRFAAEAGWITRFNVWNRQIEWITVVRRDLLARIDGYDVTLGIGNPSPWQGAEGPDLIIRGLEAGGRAWYQPSLTAFHEELDVERPDGRMIAKGRAYGRGTGYVLRRHSRGPFPIFYWLARTFAATAIALARRNSPRARYLAFVALGRWEGWTRRLWAVASPAGFHEAEPETQAVSTLGELAPPGESRAHHAVKVRPARRPAKAL